MLTKIAEYEAQIPEIWQESYIHLKEVVATHLPEGFQLVFQYGMPTFVVPLVDYPAGYLKRKDEPLPFVSIGVQKRHLALYHMGLMGNPDLLNWFQQTYQKQVPTKLNMGKSCIRFTNPKHIPYELLGELMEKITPQQWIVDYEKYQASKY